MRRHRVGRNAQRTRHVAQRVLHHRLGLAAADDDADRRGLAFDAVLLVECVKVELDLAFVLGLELADQQHRIEGENPPIGIVICRSKTKTVVEYALRNMARPLGIATYTVTPRLPASYRGELPSAEEIAKRLEGWVGLNTEGAAE